jgi:hypothetical protein
MENVKTRIFARARLSATTMNVAEALRASLEAQLDAQRALAAERDAASMRTLNEMLAHEAEARRVNDLATRVRAVQAYVFHNRGRIALPGAFVHRCNVTMQCDIVALRIRSYVDTGYLCIVGVCACDAEPPTAESAYCLPLHRGPYVDINDTYVCRRTGLGHVCNVHVTRRSTCATRSSTSDDAMTCAVSSRVIDAVRVDDDSGGGEARGGGGGDDLAAGDAAALALPYDVRDPAKYDANDEVRRPHTFSTNSACCMQLIRERRIVAAAEDTAMTALLARKRAEYQPMKDYMLAIATLRVGLVFSKQRFAAAARINRRQVLQTRHKALYMWEHPETYTATEILHAAHSVQQRHPPLAVLEMSDAVRCEQIYKYARRCTLLWFILMRRTARGRQPSATSAFLFADAVEAALFLMADGVTCRPPASTSRADAAIREVIIEPDAFLRQYLPDEKGFEHSTLPFTRFVNQQRRLKQYVDDMSDALVHAATREGIHPEQLNPSSLCIDDVDLEWAHRIVQAPFVPQRKKARSSILVTAKRARNSAQ